MMGAEKNTWSQNRSIWSSFYVPQPVEGFKDNRVDPPTIGAAICFPDTFSSHEKIIKLLTWQFAPMLSIISHLLSNLPIYWIFHIISATWKVVSMPEYPYERPVVMEILKGLGMKKKLLHIMTGPRQVGNGPFPGTWTGGFFSGDILVPPL